MHENIHVVPMYTGNSKLVIALKVLLPMQTTHDYFCIIQRPIGTFCLKSHILLGITSKSRLHLQSCSLERFREVYILNEHLPFDDGTTSSSVGWFSLFQRNNQQVRVRCMALDQWFSKNRKNQFWTSSEPWWVVLRKYSIEPVLTLNLSS